MLGRVWMAGVLAIAIAAVAMVAVACGSAEPEPAQPSMSAADITDAVSLRFRSRRCRRKISRA